MQKETRATKLAAPLAMAALMALMLLMMALFATGCATAYATDEIEHANGSPLDAVEYDPPTFAYKDGYFYGGKCYRVTDRTSGQSWWLVYMGNEKNHWVVLPIDGATQNVG